LKPRKAFLALRRHREKEPEIYEKHRLGGKEHGKHGLDKLMSGKKIRGKKSQDGSPPKEKKERKKEDAKNAHGAEDALTKDECSAIT